MSVKSFLFVVTYPLLRVEIKKVERERVRGLPPRLLRPASIEPFDLEIDGHLSPCGTAKATHLAKLAPQLQVGALQERDGTDEFACHPIECIVGDVCSKSRSRVATALGVRVRQESAKAAKRCLPSWALSA